MAALATITEVRQLGGLPDSTKLADAKIDPHLQAASRELARWLGDYSTYTGDDLADCKDAECSLTMAFLIPVLNVLCPEAITTIQKEYGDIGLNFYDADDQEKIVLMWTGRANRAIAALKNTVPPTGIPTIGWNVV